MMSATSVTTSVVLFVVVALVLQASAFEQQERGRRADLVVARDLADVELEAAARPAEQIVDRELPAAIAPLDLGPHHPALAQVDAPHALRSAQDDDPGLALQLQHDEH